jgi:hypothetical protein
MAIKMHSEKFRIFSDQKMNLKFSRQSEKFLNFEKSRLESNFRKGIGKRGCVTRRGWYKKCRAG